MAAVTLVLYAVLTVVTWVWNTSGSHAACFQCAGYCAGNPVDLVFVFDGSGSICGNRPVYLCTEWRTMLAFASDLVNYLDIRPGGDRVGFVQFGNAGTRQFGLTDYTRHDTVKFAIGSVQLKAENTNTSGGLYVARTQLFGVPNEDRADVANVVILITDGKSTRDPERTIPEAQLLADNGTRVYALGITPAVDRAEVEGIAGQPHQENVSYWFLPQFTSLDSLRVLEQVFETFCRPTQYFTTLPTTAPPCPGTETPGGCYVTREDALDHAGAEVACQGLATRMGRPGLGHLASVPDPPHNQLVLGMVRRLVASKSTYAQETALDKMWLGGFEQTHISPQWRWVTGEALVEQQGCFRENTPSEYPVQTVSAHMTPGLCTTFCRQHNLSVAALREGRICGCGSTWGATPGTEGCTDYCPGDYGQRCGGTYLNNIYLIDGAFVKWAPDQPNNFRNYQSCGMLEKDAFSDRWVMVDKECTELLTYLCDVPMDLCNVYNSKAHRVAGVCVYTEYSQSITWFIARQACKLYEGDLLTFHSAAFLGAISDLLTYTVRARQPYWIGLVGRTWMWNDGQDFLYTFFQPNEPNDDEKNCLTLYKNPQHLYGWTEERCEMKLPYICYIDMHSALPTTPAITAADTSPVQTTSQLEVTTRTPNTSIPPETATPRDSASTSNASISDFWIVVICMCLLVLILLIIIVLCCFYKKKNEKKAIVHPGDRERNPYDDFYQSTHNPTYGHLDENLSVNQSPTATSTSTPGKSAKRVRIKVPAQECKVAVLKPVTSCTIEPQASDNSVADVADGTIPKVKSRSERKKGSSRREDRHKAKRREGEEEEEIKRPDSIIEECGDSRMEGEHKEKGDPEGMERKEQERKERKRRERKKRKEQEKKRSEEEKMKAGVVMIAPRVQISRKDNYTTDFTGDSYTLDTRKNYVTF